MTLEWRRGCRRSSGREVPWRAWSKLPEQTQFTAVTVTWPIAGGGGEGGKGRPPRRGHFPRRLTWGIAFLNASLGRVGPFCLSSSGRIFSLDGSRSNQSLCLPFQTAVAHWCPRVTDWPSQRSGGNRQGVDQRQKSRKFSAFQITARSRQKGGSQSKLAGEVARTPIHSDTTDPWLQLQRSMVSAPRCTPEPSVEETVYANWSVPQ